jgi:hypothetical protein
MSKGSGSSKSSKKEMRKKILFYLVGTIFLLGIIRVKMYQHKTIDLTDSIAEYLFNKQEIALLLGEIEDIEYVTKPSFEVKKDFYELSMSLKGSKANGVLHFQIVGEKNAWKMDRVTLKINEATHRLSPAYVIDSQVYAASLSSAPLKHPVFLQGESLYVRLWLKGFVPIAKGGKIIESLDIYDAKGTLFASKKNATQYEAGQASNLEQGIPFTTTIKDLPAGNYAIAFKFEDQWGNPLETYRNEIYIRAPKDELFVGGVDYFLDAAHAKKVGATFAPGQKVFLSLNLDGFKIQDSKIAGLVDLKVLDQDGKMVASKPRFAAFNEAYDSRKNLVVNGELALKDPGVYFLSFRIQDHFSDREVEHEEKVIVKLGNP